MDLRVDDDAMKSVIAKSIVENLTPEARQALITEAVTNVLSTPKEGSGYYGNKKSPLQQAFDWAVENEARRYANEIIAKDETFRAQLQALFADVAKRIFETEQREELVKAIAETITRALTKDRY